LLTLHDWATHIVESLGYIGVAALIALEQIFPPIPSELILPLAGFVAGEGKMWLPGTVLAATAGSLIGALVLYALGAWLGEERLRWLVTRYGGILAIHEHDLDRATRWFEQHGVKVVLLGRMVPGMRSLVSVPAGLNHMTLRTFLAYTAIGSGAWNTLLIGLGWWLEDRWNLVQRYAQWYQYAALSAILIAAAWLIWRLRRRQRPRP